MVTEVKRMNGGYDAHNNDEKERVNALLVKYFGILKTKTSDEELEEIREKVSRKYAKKFGIKLD